ncbi:MAG: hypothetical protein IJ290_06840 [Bacteroidaceae bacterium]|nr:hypothetical protein [Bacteroidaceae bacterium]
MIENLLMKLRTVIYTLLLATLCMLSCSRHSVHWGTLRQVEACIEAQPDSALAALQRIDVQELAGKEERAKYALLLSMALDKNYVDKTDFEVLQPAIDYYQGHGTATDKLRTYYYQGRIYQNQQKHDELAMQCFVKAITEGATSDDILTKARVLFTQGRIYSTIYEWDKCIATYLEAAEYFKSMGRTSSYVNCIANVINAYTIIGDSVQAEKYIALAQEDLDKCSAKIKAHFYSNHLTYLVNYRQNEKNIHTVIDNYIYLSRASGTDWLSVANAYLKIGDASAAMNALSHHRDVLNTSQRVKNYALLAYIYKQEEEFKKALEMYEYYVALTDSLEYVRVKSDIQFVEEKHSLELKSIREKAKNNISILIAVVIVVIILSLLIISRYRLRMKTAESELAKQEKERYMQLYAQMEQERDTLTELLEQNKGLDQVARNALLERIALLNRFFMANITNNPDAGRKVDKEIDALLKNKEEFMASTRMAFAGSHPHFIKHLERCGLNEWEMGYCCLYALGLKGKEIGEYIQMKSHFNNSSDIRKKLGLPEHGTTLGTHIRQLLSEA